MKVDKKKYTFKKMTPEKEVVRPQMKPLKLQNWELDRYSHKDLKILKNPSIKIIKFLHHCEEHKILAHFKKNCTKKEQK